MLVEKNDGIITNAAGSFCKRELERAKAKYNMPNGTPVEEMRFRNQHPEIYRKMFLSNWFDFVYTFLKSNTWLDFDNQVDVDEDDEVFSNVWFSLQKDMNTGNIVFNHHVLANPDDVTRLINDLNEYFPDYANFHINPCCYISRMEKNTCFYGKQAGIRLLAEDCMLTERNTLLN